MNSRQALRKASAGGLAALATVAAVLLLAACGGGSEPEAHPISTVAAHPDIKITKIAGGRHSPQFEAKLAEEKTRNPGPASDLEPLPPSRFERPVAEYRAYSEDEARAVGIEVAKLRRALAAGDVAAAKRDWLAAYDHYLRLGAAYGALGKLDEEIDGNPGRLPGGAHDPEFTGLHRIEMGLWEGEAPARLLGPTDYLAAKVRRLRRVVGRVAIPPLVYATRAHEILEDAQRDMLSGVDAPWSGAGLRATDDSLAATDFVVRTLRPLLAGRDSTLEPAETELARLRVALERVRKEHGGAWPRTEALSEAQRERVDGALGSALERLAAIPGALEVVRTRPVPTIAAQAGRGR
ncbi:MAG TPA: EfeM/EfeO family lipoprotein [Solirubrobacterales bacterium]|nr:EfeM/EfeO family lipoprotein [Solirubrobacterales bacterium]